MVSCPFVRHCRSIVPPVRVRPLPASAGWAGSVPSMGILLVGHPWLGPQKPMMLLSVGWWLALCLQTPKSFPSGVTPNGDSQNSRFSYREAGPTAPPRHVLGILMFQPSSTSEVSPWPCAFGSSQWLGVAVRTGQVP